MTIINVIQGDLIKRFKEGNYVAIGHGCNCFNAMGSGIAYTIRENFPEVYEVDCETVKGARNKLGKYTFYESEFGIIYNLYTQFTFWDRTDMLSYEAVKECFWRLNELNLSGIFGIPKIGAGLACGDWNRIESIINEVTPNLNIELVEYNG